MVLKIFKKLNSKFIILKEVSNNSSLKKFVLFSKKLYKEHPYYVPGLVMDELTTLRKDKNPAFEFCESVYYLAYIGTQIVGKIAGIINHRANEIWNQRYARFGFVDFIDDEQVSKALFEAVEKWAKDKGMNAIHGPLGFTGLDHEGLLILGFNQLGTMATTYNFSYYEKHLIKAGYKKDQDWKEFHIQIPKYIPDKHCRISKIITQRYGLKIVKCKCVKQLFSYAKKIFELLNKSYSTLYGYSKFSDKQIEYYTKIYIPFLRLKMVTLIVRELDDAVIGIGIAIPSLSKALQKAKGRLFPFGWFYLLKSLYGKNKIVDLYLVGIHPKYQNKGVNALLFYDLIPILNAKKFLYAESNPELESNKKVQLQWNYFSTEHVRTRRAFIKHL